MVVNIITIPKGKIKKDACNELIVPKEVCYIKFKGDQKSAFCIDSIKEGKKTLNFYTDRDEMLILDLNNKNKIIGIELLDSKKAPKQCMR